MRPLWRRIITYLEASGGAAPAAQVREGTGIGLDGWNGAVASATTHDARLFEWRSPGGVVWLGLVDWGARDE